MAPRRRLWMVAILVLLSLLPYSLVVNNTPVRYVRSAFSAAPLQQRFLPATSASPFGTSAKHVMSTITTPFGPTGHSAQYSLPETSARYENARYENARYENAHIARDSSLGRPEHHVFPKASEQRMFRGALVTAEHSLPATVDRAGLHDDSLESGSTRNVVFHDSPVVGFQAKLVIWGARITRTYGQEEVFFDMQVQPVNRTIKKRIKMGFIDKSLYKSLLCDEAIKAYKMQCRSPDSNVLISEMSFSPNFNADINAETWAYIFRCDLSAVRKHVDTAPSLRVLVTSPDGSVLFDIPHHSSAVGSGGPINDSPTPFHLKPHVTLSICAGGLSTQGLPHMAEFIQHYVRLGAEHFVFGFQEIRPKEYEKIRNVVLRIFEPLVSQGTIALHFMNLGPKHIAWVHRDVAKMHFYQSCLYHTKAFSEYVGNFDIDEFWMPYEWKPQHGIPSLLHTLAHVYKPPIECEDWCFIAFPSYSIWDPATGFAGRTKEARDFRKALAYPFRANGTNYTWRKSIARTRNAFSSGFHSFGACLKNGIPNTQHLVDERKQKNCGHEVNARLGVVHHFFAAFRNLMADSDIRSTVDWVAPFLQDEYSSFIEAFDFTIRLPDAIDNDRPERRFNRVPGEPIV